MALNYKNTPLPRNLCSEREGDRYTHSSAQLDRIYHKLGATSRKLPKRFKGKFRIDGHTVVVFPSRGETEKAPWGGYRRRFKEGKVSGRKYGLTRVFYLVGPGRLVPVGRIHQSKYCGGTGGRRRRR